ncbi:hypothetical protein FQZ97_954160 [compost metagenome]
MHLGQRLDQCGRDLDLWQSQLDGRRQRRLRLGQRRRNAQWARIAHLLLQHRSLELIQAGALGQIDRGLLQQAIQVGLQGQLGTGSGDDDRTAHGWNPQK